MLKCSTSLWSADLANLASEIRRVEPYSERFHLDVADGHFVANLLFFPDLVRALRRHTRLPFEVHLMTTDPLSWIEPFSEAGADGFIVCLDSAKDPARVIRAIRDAGKFVGVSLRIEEDLERLGPYWGDLDLVTLFGTAVGIKGASMDARVPEKVHHATVAAVRSGLEGTGQIIQFERTVGADNKTRPASSANGHAGVHQSNGRAQEPVNLTSLVEDDSQAVLADFDEEAILRAATEIRQRRVAERVRRQKEHEERARGRLGVGRTWVVTGDQATVRCDLLLCDPPFGITKEPWEPADVEGFNRNWCDRWSGCGADFVVIFWCQGRLWDGRRWFDGSLDGYEFQQLLAWHASNHCGPRGHHLLKQSWYPIFLYRRKQSVRKVITGHKAWDRERHVLDCHVAPVPETTYLGEDMRQHPCQKPVSVMRWLIHALSEPGELVVSNFAGVAPCGIAAVQLGRRYHGIETDAKYRRIAEARIAAYGHPK